MESIDVIFYINLSHRTDRKEHFLSEIKKLCSDETKIVRIDATHHSVGIIGCAKSHITALETFQANPEWKTSIIFEDDFTFHSDNIEHNNRLLRTCITTFPNWDVISLAYNHNKDFNYSHTSEPSIKKVITHQTTSAYCITKRFLPILYRVFIESYTGLYREGRTVHEFCPDIYWHRIQAPSNWYCIFPALGYQYGNHSDIENKHTEYKC
jgi:GR25 family glycosyltransferase involved in LPS biosynthesis